MNKFKQKSIVFLLGIVVSLLLFEIVLRTIGYFHLRIARADKFLCGDRNSYTILCIGDSFTQGTGAPIKQSYPKQLQELLDKNINGINFKVINRGVGSYNTALVLREFNRWIYRYRIKPDLVILLAGGANGWNAWGYRDYIFRKSPFYRIRNLLYNIKVFKAIKLLACDIIDKFATFDLRTYDVSRDNKIPDKVKDTMMLAFRCQLEGQFEEAIFWWKKALEFLPEHERHYFYFHLSLLYSIKGDTAEAFCWIKKAIKLSRFHQYLAHLLTLQYRDPALEHETLSILNKFKNRNSIVKDFIKLYSVREHNIDLYHQNIRDWISIDIADIVNICKDNKIKLITQNYPDFYGWKYRINCILKEIAENYSIPFVDNHHVFWELRLNGGNIEDYVAADGSHCNAKGYAIMAENVYNKIIEERLLVIDDNSSQYQQYSEE